MTTSKTVSLVTPWLIQRCKISQDGKLNYDYMGSTEFEVGDQAKALKQLFAGGVVLCETTVHANDGGAPITVYAIAQEGFSFENAVDVTQSYQHYLQRMTEDKLHLKEAARFGDAVNFAATGKQPMFGRVSDCNIWFDFTKRSDGQNIVLWTLDKKLRETLLARLKFIVQSWSQKKTA